MVAVLRPRWLVLAALLAVIVGSAGLLAGESRYSPIAWLVAELLMIYAAILWATPTIPPLSTVPTDAPPARGDDPAAATRPTPGAEEQGDEAAGAPSSAGERRL